MKISKSVAAHSYRLASKAIPELWAETQVELLGVVDGKSIIFSFPQAEALPAVGTPCLISLEFASSMRTAEATILFASPTPFPHVHTSWPSDGIDIPLGKRQAQRASVSLPCSLRSDAPGGGRLLGMVENLSINGAGVRVANGKSLSDCLGQTIRLSIKAKVLTDEINLDLLCKIMRAESAGPTDAFLGLSFAIGDLPKPARVAMAALISSALSESMALLV